MEFLPGTTTTFTETSDTNIRHTQDACRENEKMSEQEQTHLENEQLSFDQFRLAPEISQMSEEQEVNLSELVENLEKKCGLQHDPAAFEGIPENTQEYDPNAGFFHGFEDRHDVDRRVSMWVSAGVEESKYSEQGHQCPDRRIKKKRNRVNLVVWNKDRKKWFQGAPDRRTGFTSQLDDYTFFRIKVPTAQDLKEKEKGAKSSRCPPDAISNCSKTVKKGRRVTSLKHIDYKKFLQCYIHVQELKNFKVDGLFNNKDSEPTPNNSTGTTTVRKQRAKTGPRQPKTSKMAATFVECLSTSGFDQLDTTGGNYHTLTSATATLGLVNEFDTQIMSIDPSNPEDAFTVDLGGIDDVANFEQVDLVDSFQVSSSPPRRNEFGTVEISFDETGKPRCTYTDLIERALSENGNGLTVSEIYQWISDHYPFFKPDDDRWKNSVRHNLSINPYFKKGEKARSGAGHRWTISEESRALRPAMRNKDFDIEDLSMCIENDTDRAVANILGQYHLAKNTMEGKVQQPMDSSASEPTTNAVNSGDGGLDSLCTPPFPEQIQEQNFVEIQEIHCAEEDKLMEISPVVIEYETNGFPGLVDHGTEFTIDLSQFQFPDTTGISFDGDCTFYTL